jgi:exodeoxyribonuclease V gamma subunit
VLTIQLSNRFEVLRDALIAQLRPAGDSPFIAQQVVVPSSGMRRALSLALADAHGVCANIDFVYLAQWLWRQIGRVVESVQSESPFAASVLTWRIYGLLAEADWCRPFARLANYLREADPLRRLDLAARLAAVLEDYITYRQDWLQIWAKGGLIALPGGSPENQADQFWQAELWRRLIARMGAEQEHPANRFFRSLGASGAGRAQPLGLPPAVHVFCLPDIPPLYLDVLIGLGEWMQVHLYALNPCREYWFEIVDPKRLSRLVVRGEADHHEVGNRLLASWGSQARAQIEMLLDRADRAPVDDSGYRDDFPDSLLGQVQRSVLDLQQILPGSLRIEPSDPSIEVHVCHSRTRELEVLQDRLLGLFAGPAPPKLTDVLVVMPDLETAAPLIDAVFGNAPKDRHLPYSVSGRGRSAINAPARALFDLLGILTSRFASSEVLALLQQPVIGRRFGIDPDALVDIERWMQVSGIRWGIDGDHRRELALPAEERFTVEDGLHRLFLAYALPEHIDSPAFGRVPAGDPEGSKAQNLGLFAQFIHQLTALRRDLGRPRLPAQWAADLNAVLAACMLPIGNELDDLGDVRAAIAELNDHMTRGGLAIEVPLPVIRAALESLLQDPSRGAVPTGTITFSSMGSLRHLPFRVICCIGLDGGAFPANSRSGEFDLMAVEPRRGDRQRRLDDRNVFLDLILAARERFYVSFTGRSTRDNSTLPPSVVVSELLEALLPAIADAPESADSLALARDRLVVEHPLQPFSRACFSDGADARIRSFNRELGEALQRAAMRAATASAGRPAGARGVESPVDEPGGIEDGAIEAAAEEEGEEREATFAAAFFALPLSPPGEEWRTVSLDQLRRFFANPSRFLLRERLGIALDRDEGPPEDDEPFIAEFPQRAALGDRLLPHAMAGLGDRELESLAAAGIEYPAGELGAGLLSSELASLRHFAARVRAATHCEPLAPVSLEKIFDLDGQAWRFTAMLTGVRPAGLLLHRYDDTRPVDYLSGWLSHLALCAAAPPEAAQNTRWVSRDGEYRLEPCTDAAANLETLLRLYRRGLGEPLHFFPKSALAYVAAGRKLRAAREKWRPSGGGARGENEDSAYRIAFRGLGDPMDADFESCALAVFGEMWDCLRDERLRSAAP